MDFKFISPNKILIIYGFMGIIFCGIVCIIMTYNPCKDTIISFKEMIKICKLKSFDENKNETFYYYEN